MSQEGLREADDEEGGVQHGQGRRVQEHRRAQGSEGRGPRAVRYPHDPLAVQAVDDRPARERGQELRHGLEEGSEPDEQRVFRERVGEQRAGRHQQPVPQVRERPGAEQLREVDARRRRSATRKRRFGSRDRPIP